MPASRAASSALARWESSARRPGASGRAQFASEIIGAHHQHRHARVRGDASHVEDRLSVSRSSPTRSSMAVRRPRRAVAETSSRYATELTFGTTTAAAVDTAIAARSSDPHGVSRPLQRIVSSRRPYSPGRSRGTRRDARGFLGVGGDGIFEIEDDRVGGECLGLLQCTFVGGRHVQRGPSRPTVAHDVNPYAVGKVRVARRPTAWRDRRRPCTASPTRRPPSCRRA